MTTQRYGIEVLHWAGMKDEFLPYLQDVLLDNPEFINFENKHNENALHIATRVNNFEIVKWLIEETDIDYKKVVDKGNILLIEVGIVPLLFTKASTKSSVHCNPFVTKSGSTVRWLKEKLPL